MIAALILLVYTGIRMAISTISADQAKYKAMLISWTKSFLILFILPYILILVISISDALVEAIPKKDTNEGFEIAIEKKVNNQLDNDSTFAAFGAFITLCLLAYYQVKFFIKYLFRFFKVAFLVIISPLITITYCLDKGSAHKNWFEEFIGSVFIQAIHALIYAVFMFSASEIAATVPIIAVAFFMALSRGEKIFAYIFNIKTEN